MFSSIIQMLSRLFSRKSTPTPSVPPLLFQDSSPDLSVSVDPTKLLSESELNRLERMHRMEEGVKDTPYLDSLGYKTIGIGHLMDARKGGFLPDYAKRELEREGRLSATTISSLYRDDLKGTTDLLERHLPWCFKLDTVRRDVLIDMCFQMGIGSEQRGTGLLGFKNTLRYIKSGNYQQAGTNMGLSAWYNQTPNRAQRRINEMITGEPYPY